jgi:DMSO/TMAO reductase YedYZ molybdopterin-dependent catalytic subunit
MDGPLSHDAREAFALWHDCSTEPSRRVSRGSMLEPHSGVSLKTQGVSSLSLYIPRHLFSLRHRNQSRAKIGAVFFKRDPKLQGDDIPTPEALPADVIVSPDTRRSNRIPPGQSRTKKWPVLDASGPPRLDPAKWKLRVEGLVNQPVEWTLHEFLQMPRVKVFSDFHCVTRWSRLGNMWEGVSTRAIVEAAGGLPPEANFVLAYGYDYGWTTNLPVEEFLAEDALVAVLHDGEPIDIEHGGPARLIVPRLYAWKSAKWLASLEFIPQDRAGFWERNGYHMHGDPWKEERHSW